MWFEKYLKNGNLELHSWANVLLRYMATQTGEPVFLLASGAQRNSTYWGGRNRLGAVSNKIGPTLKRLPPEENRYAV